MRNGFNLCNVEYPVCFESLVLFFDDDIVFAAGEATRKQRSQRILRSEKREIDDEGGGPYALDIEFCCLLLLLSVEGRLRERIVGRMRA